MSAERLFEPWEEVQRRGQDLAERLTEGFNGLIHNTHVKPPSFTWPNTPNPNPNLFEVDFPIWSFGKMDHSGINGVSAILDIGNKLGQAGAEFGASVNDMVEHFFRRLPGAFFRKEDESRVITSIRADLTRDKGLVRDKVEFTSVSDRFGNDLVQEDGDNGELNLTLSGIGSKSQGTVSVSSSYDSRTHDLENLLIARGELWTVEASHGNSTTRSRNSPLFLVQLGPVLFARDSTLLLPVHFSKQHLLWYGYDRKLFLDLKFPNGQLTRVSGEGLTTCAFLPFCGGLLQEQMGTSITPMVQLPDKSFTLGVAQELAWQRSGLMVRPTVQLSVSPTFGGSNPGWQAEAIHSIKEQLSLVYGCSFATHPSAFALVSVGRSKWSGNVGKSGVVFRVDSSISGVGQPSFSIQINSGIEF